ncbi:related to cercosporin resistance protein [Phialocephala subalpina]|uniref:Related to cercosporin resistance protein n=1 Tax=Phialocephala subalpina TaxID=576137 RepID=A0A1L7WDX5_9HELO|nr:related to cercosporin resistance protein [Phialocephala subalpina]
MSSYNEEIDPRLRDTASNAFSQHLPNPTYQTPLAPSTSRSPVGPPPPQFNSPPPNPYLPQTPQSANASDHGGGDGHHGGGPDDPKRPRACEACRGLKVRCEPDPNNPDGPCKRCAKANRNCVVTVPSRKRQKKTDSRVAELEKKIDALTQSLAQKSGTLVPAIGHGHGGEGGAAAVQQEGMNTQPQHNPYQQVTNGGYGSPYGSRSEVRADSWSGYPKAPEFEARKTSAPPMVVAGQKRKHLDSRDYPSTPDSSSARKSSEAPTGFLVDAGTKPAANHEYADVVDRGLLTADMAAKMFECYVEKMVPHMPAVVFPAGTTAAEVRKTQPTLFLAILSAASGSNYPELQRQLTKEVMSIYAERVICNGEKTLELIQALHISTLWYWPPEHFEELKFYQLIHIAAVMAIDIGMGKKNKKQKAKAAGLWRDHPWRRTPYPDPESIEARRAWLASYFLCCNASMGLRRPNLIRWAPFMEECVEVLENSPDAAPTDKTLCQWVRSQHIAEEVGTRFSMDDPAANVSIADQSVQYALKGFENDLEKWSKNIPPEAATPSLKVTEHVVNLYMHEVAMHVDHNVEEFKPPFTEANLRGLGDSDQGIKLSHAHVNALSICLASIDAIFETFLKFDVETIRCLPVANFVRVAYAVVVLIKMYFAATTPNSELGKVIVKENMKVEYYLDGLVGIFRASAAEEKSRPSGKFLMVLLMLKTWFHRQREGGQPVPANEAAPKVAGQNGPATETSEAAQKATTQQRNGQQSSYSPANTPLQLLSEVATGNSGGQSRPDNITNYPGGNNDWQQPSNQMNYTNYTPPISGFGSYGMGVPPNFDPGLGLDLGYNMGDGLEQAMGMTLGVGDFGYFNDDNFFGGIMDSVGQGATFEGF